MQEVEIIQDTEKQVFHVDEEALRAWLERRSERRRLSKIVFEDLAMGGVYDLFKGKASISRSSINDITSWVTQDIIHSLLEKAERRDPLKKLLRIVFVPIYGGIKDRPIFDKEERDVYKEQERIDREKIAQEGVDEKKVKTLLEKNT